MTSSDRETGTLLWTPGGNAGEPTAPPGPPPPVWEQDPVMVCRTSHLRLTFTRFKIHTLRLVAEDLPSPGPSLSRGQDRTAGLPATSGSTSILGRQAGPAPRPPQLGSEDHQLWGPQGGCHPDQQAGALGCAHSGPGSPGPPAQHGRRPGSVPPRDPGYQKGHQEGPAPPADVPGNRLIASCSCMFYHVPSRPLLLNAPRPHQLDEGKPHEFGEGFALDAAMVKALPHRTLHEAIFIDISRQKIQRLVMTRTGKAEDDAPPAPRHPPSPGLSAGPAPGAPGPDPAAVPGGLPRAAAGAGPGPAGRGSRAPTEPGLPELLVPRRVPHRRLRSSEGAVLVRPRPACGSAGGPDPQRSICIGKRNGERRGRGSGRVRPGRRGAGTSCGRPVGAGGRQGGREAGGLTWSASARGLGGSAEESRVCTAGSAPAAAGRPFMRGRDLGGRRRSRGLPCGPGPRCAKDPVRPRTCQIGAQRPALSRAPSLRRRVGAEARGAGGCRRDLGRGQPRPAASSRPYLAACLCLRHGPEHTLGGGTAAREGASLPSPPGLLPWARSPRTPAPGRPPGWDWGCQESPGSHTCPLCAQLRARALGCLEKDRGLQSSGDTAGTGEGDSSQGTADRRPKAAHAETRTDAPRLSQARGPQEGRSACCRVWKWLTSLSTRWRVDSWVHVDERPPLSSQTFLSCGEWAVRSPPPSLGAPPEQHPQLRAPPTPGVVCASGSRDSSPPCLRVQRGPCTLPSLRPEAGSGCLCGPCRPGPALLSHLHRRLDPSGPSGVAEKLQTLGRGEVPAHPGSRRAQTLGVSAPRSLALWLLEVKQRAQGSFRPGWPRGGRPQPVDARAARCATGAPQVAALLPGAARGLSSPFCTPATEPAATVWGTPSDFSRSRGEQGTLGPAPSPSGEDGPRRADTAAGFRGGWTRDWGPAPAGSRAPEPATGGHPPPPWEAFPFADSGTHTGPGTVSWARSPGAGPLLCPAKPGRCGPRAWPLEHRTRWARPSLCPQDKKVSLLALEDVLGRS
ncbi:collagen alpha-1(I) chain-like [Hippopotamus amphibius kiboko]|uniref:collagen alpha-1(I) chain-like n=1 Tax=Hippopotamus amphibius kiboko TaxID=575201 RepID=UPI00259A64EC|nr:collagen alpha-1(I) chain-like [Hippopotamus amphibius kiboko]